MVKPRQPINDPDAFVKTKTCTKCKAIKTLSEYPLNYKKDVGPKQSKYRSRCLECHNAGMRTIYANRKAKSLTVNFDGVNHLSDVSDGALINIENVEESKEK
jgi:hypothetical protein